MSTGAVSDEEKAESGAGKRKRHQISLVEYFSKRKKLAATACTGENANEEMKGAKNNDPDYNKRRDLMRAAAEKRLSPQRDGPLSPSHSFPSSSSQQQRNDNSETEDMDGSLPLFPLSPTLEGAQDDSSDSFISSAEVSFNRLPTCAEVLPKLSPQPDHTILCRAHFSASSPPEPYPERYRDSWNRDHVRMPCSKENLYPTLNNKIQKRWELIERCLLKPFMTSRDLQDAITTYNVHYKDKWDFEGWHSFCNLYLTPRERDDLFHDLLPATARLALQLPFICTQPPPLLKRQKNHSLTLSQKQAASFLANAFFCSFPRRNTQKNSEYATYPDINFNRLFRGTKDMVNPVKAQKLKSLLHYFRRVTADMPTGTITFSRKVLKEENTPGWDSCDIRFKDLNVKSEGTIEDDGHGYLQVDFANRLIGGGVIGEGCVQEEIRFLVCPAMILSRLFTERLDPNECLIITGAERFSTYIGYAQTFKWLKDHIDLTPRDRWGRHYTEVVAIDAHVFHIYADQFKPNMLKRELNKAFCGFRNPNLDHSNLPAIATGNWGCGAFGGDARLKALIQLTAAAVAERDIVYFTFGDKALCEEIKEMHQFLRDNRITIRTLWDLLQRYERELRKQQTHIKLYPYIKMIYREYTDETDNEEEQYDKLLADGDDMINEPLGYAPGEIASDASPDYRADTP